MLTADRRERLEDPLCGRLDPPLAALDDHGRWVDGGRITCRIFVSNVATLCSYLELVEN